MKKTKLLSFNPTKNYNFPPEIGFGNEYLEVVKSAKVLGVIISDDLRWSLNTNYIVKKAKSRIWALRRLKNLGLDNLFILDV